MMVKARVCPPDCGPASRAVERQDWAWVAGWLNGRLGVDVSADWVAENMPKRGPHYASGYYYSDGSWETWFKSRMRDADMFRRRWRRTDKHVGNRTVDRFTVTLHVFFLSVEETPEQLEILRRPDRTIIYTGPDTPGIERREAPLGPINSTASKVLNTKGKK